MSNILMIHFSPYPMDVRPRREAETLIEAGYSVDTICYRRKNQINREVHSGVTAYRINIKKRRSSKLRYIWEYFHFASVAFFRTILLHSRNKYDLIHIHNMPDFLVFCAIIPKLTGAKVILDLHDPVPEIFMTKYKISENHPVIRLLKIIEKISIKFADHILTPNISFRNLFISRGCPPEKINVLMNTPMEKLFQNQIINAHEGINVSNGEFVLMYHGTIAERNGCIDLVEAINIIKTEIPGLKLHIFGNGESVELLKSRINELKLSQLILYHGHVMNDFIFSAIKKINLGIIPNQLNPFTNLNFPVRIFEYLALKKPVIVPKTDGILDYFGEESIIYFEPGNISKLANTIIKCYKSPSILKEKVKKGYKVYQDHTWVKQRSVLENIVHHLISKKINNND